MDAKGYYTHVFNKLSLSERNVLRLALVQWRPSMIGFNQDAACRRAFLEALLECNKTDAINLARHDAAELARRSS